MTLELRTCQFCKEQEFVYKDGEYRLLKYGVRHYAHPICLATNRGSAARDLVPEHERRYFGRAVENANDWAKAFIAIEDNKRRELERRLAGEDA